MSEDTTSPSRDAFVATAIEAIAKVKRVPAESMTVDSTFEEIGLDSLDAMEVLFEIEEQTDLDIPDTAIRSMNSVSDVVDGLCKLARGESLEPETPEV